MKDNEIKAIKGMRLSVICREVDKNTGAIATYVCKNDITYNDIFFFRMRSTLNRNLTYYTVLTRISEGQEALEDVLSFLKRRRLSDTDIERYGDIIKL